MDRGGGTDLNCLVFSAEMSATFKFNVASLLLLLLLTLLMPCLVCSACNKVYSGGWGEGRDTQRGVISFGVYYLLAVLAVLIAQFPCGLV